MTKRIALLLIAAAWLGAIVCTLFNAGVLNGGLMFSGRTVAGFNESCPPTTMPVWRTLDTVLVGLRWLLQLHVLWWLRAAGVHWRVNPSDGAGLAVRFRGLGHALLLLGVFGALVPSPTFVRAPRMAFLVTQRFGFESLYMLAVSCLCIYAMAHFIAEATRLRRENEEFV